jgi:hypothetical protein
MWLSGSRGHGVSSRKSLIIFRHIIRLDGYVEESASEPATFINVLGDQISFNGLTNILSGTKIYPNKFVLELSPVEVIGGFGNNLMLYSSDDFLNITLLKVHVN